MIPLDLVKARTPLQGKRHRRKPRLLNQRLRKATAALGSRIENHSTTRKIGHFPAMWKATAFSGLPILPWLRTFVNTLPRFYWLCGSEVRFTRKKSSTFPASNKNLWKLGVNGPNFVTCAMLFFAARTLRVIRSPSQYQIPLSYHKYIHTGH